jgi:hypothetical protein
MMDEFKPRWYAGSSPHRVVGGKHDGLIVDYRGVRGLDDSFHYDIPGLLTFAPLYLHADRLEPIGVDEANAIDRAWWEARREKMASREGCS